MKEEQYKFVTEYFSASKSRINTIKALHDVLPIIMIVFYPLQLLYILAEKGVKNITFMKFFLVPLAVLVLVTLMRYIISAKRPYEVYDYTPVVKKNTKGKSFPSRHTASAFIIAMAFMYLDVSLGIVMMLIACGVALTRVLSGVHFIRDVIGGALISIIVGVFCFFLI